MTSTPATTPSTPPLALYVHMPWCVKKCPYCDFNSHGLVGKPPPYATYVDCLLADLDADLTDFGPELATRPIVSVFFGGGTPSLFTPELIGQVLAGARARLNFAADCEITLETNPGTVEHGRFDGYLEAGVNRLSFGVQSFDDAKLRRLGRIHSAAEATQAVRMARAAGYDNFNIDLMYALPGQDLRGAIDDVAQAMALEPTHISHYQLTLEPGTSFFKHPPKLPDDDAAWDMMQACQQHLATGGYGQYEISAYARAGRRCAHNLNYWAFGDYLGIGAGAHGKITRLDPNGGLPAIARRSKLRAPASYMAKARGDERIEQDQHIGATERPFEYMLNALRLIDGTPMAAFSRRTGLPLDAIKPTLDIARARGWLVPAGPDLRTTDLGQRFLNDVIELFMD